MIYVFFGELNIIPTQLLSIPAFNGGGRPTMSINVLHNYQHAPKTTDLYATWATSPHAEFYTKRGFKPTLRREKDSRLVSPEGSI